MSEHLSERKKKILQAIIEAHIVDGEPVGSKFLAQDKQLACSSATIRNEMAELEALGYLEQPHTSAGRVPSALGYRFYVDGLAERYRMTSDEIAEIDRTLRYKLHELDEILADASRLASSLTHYTSIAIKPRVSSVRVDRFEMMYVDPRNFVLVMLLRGGTVKTKYVRLGFDITGADLSTVTALFNRHLINLTSEELTVSRICRLEQLAGVSAPLVSPIVKTVWETMTEQDGGDVRVQGVDHLLEYPEYADVDHMKDMLGMFEHKQELLDLVETGHEDDRDVHVYIGKENAMDVMSRSALVYREIRQNGRVVGAIGVIGPCRMNYSRVIETLNRLGDGIGDAIGEETDRKKERNE